MRRLITAIIALLTLTLILGFLVFLARLPAPQDAQTMPEADAIVVLTGGGGTRIQAAAQLLKRAQGQDQAQGRDQQLLISGVNDTVGRAEIQKLFHLSPALMECCVVLGYRARDTLGNAGEIAAWANANGYKSLIVVTSNYHMPRALIELRTTQPDITFLPFPVRANNFAGPDKWRRIGVEYLKYVVILGREMLLRPGTS